MFLVGFGVRTIGFLPRQSLGTGWLVRTIGTLIPLGPDTHIHLSAQNGEMAHSDPLIVAVKLANLPTAFAALRVFYSTLYGDDVSASFVRLDTQHPNIGYIQWYGDLGAHFLPCLTCL